MKKAILFAVILLLSVRFSAQTSIFNELLQKHVAANGNVDYSSFKADNEKFTTYIRYLENTSPEKNWSANKEKAFWINAYNAYTIKLILANYPVKSIMDIKENNHAAWKIKFANVGGTHYTLDAIEHEILRTKFADPRIHVGVNCASISCPKLSNLAFTEENIENQLEKLMNEFINDNSRNKITENHIQISSIFDWFKDDFTKSTTLIGYLNKYATPKINEKIKIDYLKYNWSLNKK